MIFQLRKYAYILYLCRDGLDMSNSSLFLAFTLYELLLDCEFTLYELSLILFTEPFISEFKYKLSLIIYSEFDRRAILARHSRDILSDSRCHRS